MINTEIYSENRNHWDIFIKALVANMALAFLKLSMGLLGYSKLILMDGILSFSNAVVLLLMWQGDRLERKMPDERHPYGYGKIIFVVATFSGFIVLILSIYMFLYSAYGMTWLEVHRSHTGAMMVTVISIFANEVLYHLMNDIGKQNSNNVLVWNAMNNRINSVVSSIILVCVILASVGVSSAERTGVAVVSLVIFMVSVRILLKSFSGIMDKNPHKSIINKIRSCASNIPGVKIISDIKAKYIGSYLHVDLNIYVDESLTMKEADLISQNVEKTIISRVPLTREANAIII